MRIFSIKNKMEFDKIVERFYKPGMVGITPGNDTYENMRYGIKEELVLFVEDEGITYATISYCRRNYPDIKIEGVYKSLLEL